MFFAPSLGACALESYYPWCKGTTREGRKSTIKAAAQELRPDLRSQRSRSRSNTTTIITVRAIPHLLPWRGSPVSEGNPKIGVPYEPGPSCSWLLMGSSPPPDPVLSGAPACVPPAPLASLARVHPAPPA